MVNSTLNQWLVCVIWSGWSTRVQISAIPLQRVSKRENSLVSHAQDGPNCSYFFAGRNFCFTASLNDGFVRSGALHLCQRVSRGALGPLGCRNIHFEFDVLAVVDTVVVQEGGDVLVGIVSALERSQPSLGDALDPLLAGRVVDNGVRSVVVVCTAHARRRRRRRCLRTGSARSECYPA